MTHDELNLLLKIALVFVALCLVYIGFELSRKRNNNGK